MVSITILEADLGRQEHRDAVVTLLDAYAQDPMGNGKALSAEVRRDLIPGLQQHPTTIIFLAFQNKKAAGFSRTVYVEAAGGALFLSKALQNNLIHD